MKVNVCCLYALRSSATSIVTLYLQKKYSDIVLCDLYHTGAKLISRVLCQMEEGFGVVFQPCYLASSTMHQTNTHRHIFLGVPILAGTQKLCLPDGC